MNRDEHMRLVVRSMQATAMSLRTLIEYDAYVFAVERTPKAFSQVAAQAIEAIAKARRC